MLRPLENSVRVLLSIIALPLLSLACYAPFFPNTDAPFSSRDQSRANIRIVSVVASTPGGACSPPRENADFICKYTVRWEVEYWASTRASLDCTVYRDGEEVTFYAEGVEAGEGKWENDLEVGNFYQAMGEYTEQLVCSVREGNRQGEMWASAEASYPVALTTTWEE